MLEYNILYYNHVTGGTWLCNMHWSSSGQTHSGKSTGSFILPLIVFCFSEVTFEDILHCSTLQTFHTSLRYCTPMVSHGIPMSPCTVYCYCKTSRVVLKSAWHFWTKVIMKVNFWFPVCSTSNGMYLTWVMRWHWCGQYVNNRRS